jgi:diguanylate cyclase (GGDEF)-like protein
MNADESAFSNGADKEVVTLIATLHATGQRLEELTGGEVDAVVGLDGATFLLRRAQEDLRVGEAARQAAILNGLPAHIALVDSQGVIVSCNRAWQDFAEANGLPPPGYGVGVNYLETCDEAREGHEAANGIRSVLAGDVLSFSFEYPCHSPTQQRWFLMTVTPSSHDVMAGAVIMHLNITERMQAEIGMKRLNRVYAVLSEINALIVRVHDQDELFSDACRIAVEHGGFDVAQLSMIDRAALKVESVAMAGKNPQLVSMIELILRKNAGHPAAMVAQAIAKKKAMVSNDSQNDAYVPFGDVYAALGVHSKAILPLIVADEVVGVLALYAAEHEFFHAEEMRLLNGLADDIALAIHHIDQQRQLDHLASYDPLTGLANRRLLLGRLTQRMGNAADNAQRLALLLIDMERFKNINDSLGRPAGDALLQQVAQWLTQQAGDVSRVARIGEDHFAVVLPEKQHASELTAQLDTIIETFLGHSFRLNDDVYRISAKFGVAIYPDDGVEADILFNNAETALKKAKAGGHRHLLYTAKMSEAVMQRLTLENKLRKALDNQEFVLHYQPKVHLASGELTGVEALIRWNDPLTGLVQPNVFIPILEEVGLIYEVGRWALNQSLKDYRRWRAMELHAVRIAVNVSPWQLRHPGFVAMIERMVALDAYAAQGLELEITEGAIMDDLNQASSSLQAIRALGISIAIDDFGTGFSSLGYLSKLPIDTLKVDRMFVTGMAADPQGLSLVSTIINLAHSLKLKVVAEGVETDQQSQLLRLLKCDEMQGHRISKPVPTDELEHKYLIRPTAT